MNGSLIQGNDELVKTLISLAEVKTLDLTDTNNVKAAYTTKPVFEVKAVAAPQPDGIDVHTLDGFVDLVKEKIEGVENAEGSYIVHVVDHETVELKALKSDKWGRRLRLICAQPVVIDPFPFGSFLEQEIFVIQVAAKFVDGGDKGYVLDMASSLTTEATTNSNDNGFVQGATVKRGMRVKENVILKSRVKLSPFRTFPEIGQPASEFVFRARSISNERPPELLLIEADGGKWKVDAINEVARYLRSVGLEIPVIS
jgi:hypothetical protein